MGVLKSLGKLGKGVLKVAGGIGKKVAPLVGLIPGVGTVAGGAIGGLSSLASDIGSGNKISLGNALKSGATGALSGLAGAKLLGGKGLPGLLSKAKTMLAGGPSLLPGGGGAPAMSPGGPVDDFGAGVADFGGMTGAPAQGGAGGGLLDTIKNFIMKNPGKVAGLGLGVANTLAAGKQSGAADASRKVALARLAERPPEDLSSLFAGGGNPYAQQVPGASRKTALRALQGAY